MRGGRAHIDFQTLGVLREYENAVRTGAVALALGIRIANRDLKRDFDAVDKRVALGPCAV
jgi:hypothetical protein